MNSILQTRDGISVEAYLASEALSPVKREYVAGRVYAMAGTSVRHNRIALNIAVALIAGLKGSPWQVFFADVKLHIPYHRHDLFYYPDLMICCDPTDAHSHYRERPCLLVEVLSDSTRGIDTREKLIAYTQIDSLQGYLVVDQDRIGASLFRRDADWGNQRQERIEARLLLPCAEGLELALADVYAGVDWRSTTEGDTAG